ncbi:fungal specific transcription factor domain-containing protein [Histoplasma capsulatum]|uniref:Fungal specific transcription factor domain-containing protein n=1 Tax=Ajellomyces capsulatus TaxID=5037 RepID=A0A8A1MJS1_AJECA|nr:fungal specific transcription factor domain-containing protein [Histoplasma capsulatum]
MFAVQTVEERVNLTYAEDRIRKLEAAISTLLPNADIEALLESSSSKQSEGQRRQEPELDQKPVSVVVPKYFAVATEPSSEALPQLADGFGWAERELTLTELSDGMAALSIRPEGAGYLGGPSSVAPLRALLMGGWDVNSSTQSEAAGKVALDSQSMMWQSTHPGIAPSQIVAQTVMDAYFANYHTSYPFLHEETFRAQFGEQIPRPRGHAWPILLNTVFALGAWTIGDDTVDIHEIFYNEANRYLQHVSVFEIGNLACVQAFLLLSNYTQKRNKPNTGWNYLGLAIRMALSLRLHKEFPEWNISLLQREMRRRVWWGVFIFDSGASITFGRPILLPDASIMDAKQVQNIPDNALTASTEAVPLETDEPTLYSSLIAQAKFHLTTNELYHRLLSNRNLSAEETLKLQTPIDDFLCSLPSFFERDDSHQEECRMRCLQAARATIKSISGYMEMNPYMRLDGWYMLYFLFQAALIPVLFLITTPTSPSAPSWLSDIQSVRCLLSPQSSLGNNNHLAARCLEVINRLCGPLSFPSPSPQPLPTGSASGSCPTFSNNSNGNHRQYINNSNIASFPQQVSANSAKTGAGPSGSNSAAQHDDERLRHAWEANMAGIISQEMGSQNQDMMFSDAYSFFAGVAGNHENLRNFGVVPGVAAFDTSRASGSRPDLLGADLVAGGTSGGSKDIASMENAAARGGSGPGPAAAAAAAAAAGMEFFDWMGFGAEGGVEGRRYI